MMPASRPDTRRGASHRRLPASSRCDPSSSTRSRACGVGGAAKPSSRNRHLEYKVLRKIAEKAWPINTIIVHQQNKIRPFLKPSTDVNIRGFQLRVKDRDAVPNEAQKKRLKDVEGFLLRTGWGPDRSPGMT